MLKRLAVLCLLFSSLTACMQSESSKPEKQEILVSAAASLSGALEKITEKFEAEHPTIVITKNFGGSGKLAQQIQQGAPADVFLSANQHWMDVLENDKLILAETRVNFAKNKLVVITQKESDSKINTSLRVIQPNSIGQIAIGNPESVPAGNYAKDALTNLGLWGKLMGHFVYAKDVRQVLTYVESGNAEIGFVYGSDPHRANGVKISTEIDADLYTPIVYPAAVISSSDNQEIAKKFLEYLQTDSAKAILKDYGFTE